MEQGNNTCMSLLTLQRATRTNKRIHGSPLLTRHVFPSSMRYTGKAEGRRCECGPPCAFGNVQLTLWRSQPVGTPPGRIASGRRHMLANTIPYANFTLAPGATPTSTHVRRSMLANTTSYANFALAPGATPTSTHTRRNMLANRASHGNPASVHRQRIATTNSSHATISSKYGAHIHKAWRWPPSASSHKFSLSAIDTLDGVVAPSGAYIFWHFGTTLF